MRVYKKIGSKERLFEMFENINNVKINETMTINDLKFSYDEKGNWIPVDFENHRIGLRSIEQPVGSNKWNVAIVTLDDNGDFDDIYEVKDNWDDAKLELLNILNKK